MDFGVSPSLSSLSFECPLAVQPIQVISILQRSTAKAKAKSNRERVLIRGMKSQAYGAPPPPLRGPLLGRHGLKIRVSSCVSHSNSALMFERAEKMPALRGQINILWKRNVKTSPVISELSWCVCGGSVCFLETYNSVKTSHPTKTS